MAYDTATRKRVRADYVQGMALTAAAARVPVPYNTARNWKREAAKNGDDWDIARGARLLTKSGAEEMVNLVLGELATQFLATLNALKEDGTMKVAERGKLMVAMLDGYAKALSVSRQASSAGNQLAAALDVVRFLTDQFLRSFPKLHAPFVDACEKLGPDIAREFGGQA